VEVNANDKHSSLQQYRIITAVESFKVMAPGFETGTKKKIKKDWS
jgi:hypothetical protein